MLVFPSMPEVMRLNKVGGFTMASLGQSKSVVAEFMKKKKADDKEAAKAAKNYGEADRIRNELLSQGIELIDKPGGITEWVRA